MEIRVDNVNGALAKAVDIMRRESGGFLELAPRGGKVTREWPEPVVTVYHRPWRCVLFNEVRDANPFFHLMEAIWMLAGRDDAEWISQFSSKIAQFAEDDGFFHGGYGARWRDHPWGFEHGQEQDQLKALIALLRREPHTRRAALAMWDPVSDLGTHADSKRDLPCNTHVYFKIRDGKLNMTVCCRSNDIILGAYGANAVHFSFLQSFVAAAVGVAHGTYIHVSDSWHYYVDNPYVRRVLEDETADCGYRDYYHQGRAAERMASMEVVNTPHDTWLRDAANFVDDEDWNDTTKYRDGFFSQVAVPARDAWAIYKRGDLENALTRARNIHAPDWKRACVEWLQRRAAKQEGAK